MRTSRVPINWSRYQGLALGMISGRDRSHLQDEDIAYVGQCSSWTASFLRRLATGACLRLPRRTPEFCAESHVSIAWVPRIRLQARGDPDIDYSMLDGIHSMTLVDRTIYISHRQAHAAHGTDACISRAWKRSHDSPFRQAEQVVPLGALGLEAGNAEPARLAVIAGPVRRAHRIFDDVLAGRGGLQLGLCGQTASDDHTGHGTRRGGAEGARGEGMRCGAREWAQRGSESRHGSGV